MPPRDLVLELTFHIPALGSQYLILHLEQAELKSLSNLVAELDPNLDAKDLSLSCRTYGFPTIKPHCRMLTRSLGSETQA